MGETRERESEFERRIREQTAYRDAKREARLLKSGGFAEHPWVQDALQIKNHARQAHEPGETPMKAREDHRRSLFLRTKLLVTGGALLLLVALALTLYQGPASPGAESLTSVSLWHSLMSESELLQLRESLASLSSDELDFDLVSAHDLPTSLHIALLRSAPPEIAIVDEATAEQLRVSDRLILGEDGETTGHFPLSPSRPWSRPLVLVVFAKDRSREESARILALARELHRSLWDQFPEAP